MSSVRYKIYPSLLDKFQSYLDADIEAESFWNIDSETGEMKRTPDEIASQREQELLDSINRVPSEPIEAADKGTCFNEIVDCLINGRSSSREDLEIDFGVLDQYGAFHPNCCDYNPVGIEVVQAKMNGFTFLFDQKTCEEAARYFGEFSIDQHFCKGVISTVYGDVELYGYADEISLDKVFDIKTTSSYSFGKFERAWQKDVYPYCLVQSGEMDRVSEFEYTVFQLTKPSSRNPVISAKMYCEPYTFDFAASEKRLRLFLERFIEWLESHRADITDKKIFNDVSY